MITKINRWWLDAWDYLGDGWDSKIPFGLLWLSYVGVGAVIGLIVGAIADRPGVGAVGGICVGASTAGVWLAAVVARRPRGRRPDRGR